MPTEASVLSLLPRGSAECFPLFVIKFELIVRIAEENPRLRRRDAEAIENTILGRISDALVAGERMELRRFFAPAAGGASGGGGMSGGTGGFGSNSGSSAGTGMGSGTGGGMGTSGSGSAGGSSGTSGTGAGAAPSGTGR